LFPQEPVHLLAAEIADEVRVGNLREALEVAATETAKKAEGSQPIGGLENALEAFEQHE
jgi:hypothetical protein